MFPSSCGAGLSLLLPRARTGSEDTISSADVEPPQAAQLKLGYDAAIAD